jgi:hypothetical protein
VINVGSSITANGYSTYDLAPGQYRLAIVTAAAVYAALTTIPRGSADVSPRSIASSAVTWKARTNEVARLR